MSHSLNQQEIIDEIDSIHTYLKLINHKIDIYRDEDGVIVFIFFFQRQLKVVIVYEKDRHRLQLSLQDAEHLINQVQASSEFDVQKELLKIARLQLSKY